MESTYTGRKVAIFADAHSLLEPTYAVLEDMRKRGITEIYSLGDNIGFGPNPGEVMDVMDAYGKPQKAYILGINKPIEEFSGRLIAIIHRLNDVKNNWVIADKYYSKEEIYEKVKSIEQYFKVEILI